MGPPVPAFATDPETSAYYDRRAREYDEWYLGQGVFAGRERPGWDEAVNDLVALVGALAPARTLDVACGTGFLSRHLSGFAVGVDLSPAMVSLARDRIPGGRAMVGDALRLPAPAGAFERVFTAHFYGHLPGDERHAFLTECRRVATSLVVVDSAARPGVDPEQWQVRVLNDGSRHRVYKRYLTGSQLAAEIGGRVVADGDWFVAAGADWG
jgi:ubiquinone/menaquinone biosynthesis C-methylase UbiE